MEIKLTIKKNKTMFGLFKKKTEKERLSDLYSKLMKESHRLSTIDRTQSDKKFAEAQEIMNTIDKLKVQ